MSYTCLKLNSMNHQCIKVVILLTAILYFMFYSINISCAQTTTEEFLNSIVTDLPPSDVTCRGLGILQELITRTPVFKSEGNSFFLDQENREIALFERAEVININDNNKKITADLFVRVPNVQRGDLVNLLLQKRLVATRNAQAVFAVKVTVNNNTDTYIYTGKDSEGDPINSTIITKIKKIGNVTVNNEQFVTLSGTTKIRFPVPPKLVAPGGGLIDVFGDVPSGIVCKFKKTPIHDFDLTDLKDAFDEQLANDIIQEAGEEAVETPEEEEEI